MIIKAMVLNDGVKKALHTLVLNTFHNVRRPQ